MSTKALELCPLCDSPRIISARHDNDWGGENSVGTVNPITAYAEFDLSENGDVESFGDIDIRVCLACSFTWDRYTKIPECIARLRAELDNEKAGNTLLENELNRQLNKKNASLNEAIRVIQAFSQHDDYIGRKTVMDVADAFLTHLKETK